MEGHETPGLEGRGPYAADGRPRSTGGWVAFALAALLLVGALVAMGTAFTADQYTMTFRTGPQPDLAAGEEDPNTLVDVSFRFTEHEARAEGESERGLYDDIPQVGATMDILRYTTYTGFGLLLLATLSVVLHRVGVLVVRGPAPVFALFGLVLLVVGLIEFGTTVHHAVRAEYLGGRISPTPAFFTIGADGQFFHDVTMLPGGGWWRIAVGTAVAAVGSVVMFWGDVRAAWDAVARGAEAVGSEDGTA